MTRDDIDDIAEAVADRVLERMAARLSPAGSPSRRAVSGRVPRARVPPWRDDGPKAPDPEPEGIADLLGDIAGEVVEDAVEYTAEKVQDLISGFVKAKGRDEAVGALKELGIATKAELASAPKEKLAEAARRLAVDDAEEG